MIPLYQLNIAGKFGAMMEKSVCALLRNIQKRELKAMSLFPPTYSPADLRGVLNRQ